MANFTGTEGRYLSFIQAYTNRHGYPPAESEIAAALCVSAPSVNQMMKKLERNGMILRQPGRPRSIQLLLPEEEIPSWGSRGRGPSQPRVIRRVGKSPPQYERDNGVGPG